METMESEDHEDYDLETPQLVSESIPDGRTPAVPELSFASLARGMGPRYERARLYDTSVLAGLRRVEVPRSTPTRVVLPIQSGQVTIDPRVLVPLRERMRRDEFEDSVAIVNDVLERTTIRGSTLCLAILTPLSIFITFLVLSLSTISQAYIALAVTLLIALTAIELFLIYTKMTQANRELSEILEQENREKYAFRGIYWRLGTGALWIEIVMDPIALLPEAIRAELPKKTAGGYITSRAARAPLSSARLPENVGLTYPPLEEITARERSTQRGSSSRHHYYSNVAHMSDPALTAPPPRRRKKKSDIVPAAGQEPISAPLDEALDATATHSILETSPPTDSIPAAGTFVEENSPVPVLPLQRTEVKASDGDSGNLASSHDSKLVSRWRKKRGQARSTHKAMATAIATAEEFGRAGPWGPESPQRQAGEDWIRSPSQAQAEEEEEDNTTTANNNVNVPPDFFPPHHAGLRASRYSRDRDQDLYPPPSTSAVPRQEHEYVMDNGYVEDEGGQEVNAGRESSGLVDPGFNPLESYM